MGTLFVPVIPFFDDLLIQFNLWLGPWFNRFISSHGPLVTKQALLRSE
jgi:hypothetical protein